MKTIRNISMQFCRFGLVGIFCLCVDYGLLIFSTSVLGVDYFLSSGVSYAVSIFLNYLLSMRFVFHSKEDISKSEEVAIFFFLSLVGLVLNQIVMWCMVELFHMFYATAKLLATLLVTTYNFVSRKACLE